MHFKKKDIKKVHSIVRFVEPPRAHIVIFLKAVLDSSLVFIVLLTPGAEGGNVKLL